MSSGLERYATRGHRRVNGWLHHDAISMVRAVAVEQTRAGITGHVAEIGVHHGRLFILLYLLSGPDEKGLAIDLFGRQELNADHSGGGDLGKFRDNLARHADLSRLVVYEGDSSTMTSADVRRLVGGAIKMFSVDGGHTPELTRGDLESAEGAIADGGLVILDDVFNEVWPGVVSGTAEFFSRPRRLVPFAIGGNKTLMTTAAYAVRYRNALLSASLQKPADHTFFGFPVLSFDFAPQTMAERIGKMGAWRSIRETTLGRLARRTYRALSPVFSRG
jgi:hypothetical protein